MSKILLAGLKKRVATLQDRADKDEAAFNEIGSPMAYAFAAVCPLPVLEEMLKGAPLPQEYSRKVGEVADQFAMLTYGMKCAALAELSLAEKAALPHPKTTAMERCVETLRLTIWRDKPQALGETSPAPSDRQQTY